MKLNDYIKTLREKRQLTQEQAAEQMAVSVGSIQNWENGRAIPEIQNLVQIAKTYRVEVNSLLQTLARDLDYLSGKIDTIQVCPWVDLLPETFDYYQLENLRLSEVAGELLTLFKLASFWDERQLMSYCLEIEPDKGKLITLLIKLESCRFIELRPTTSAEKENQSPRCALTPLGETCQQWILRHPRYLTSLYELPFNQFLAVCDSVGLLNFVTFQRFSKLDETDTTYSGRFDCHLTRAIQSIVELELCLHERLQGEIIQHFSKNQLIAHSSESWLLALDEAYYSLDFVALTPPEASSSITHTPSLEGVNDDVLSSTTLYRVVVLPTQKALDFMASLNGESVL